MQTYKNTVKTETKWNRNINR